MVKNLDTINILNDPAIIAGELRDAVGISMSRDKFVRFKMVEADL